MSVWKSDEKLLLVCNTSRCLISDKTFPLFFVYYTSRCLDIRRDTPSLV